MKEVFKDIGQAMENGPKQSGVGVITRSIKAALKPNVFTGVAVFGNAARTLADAATANMESEAARRGLTRETSVLDAARYGAKP